ncbi:MAG: VUT family protein [Erysipelotrichales bacterium]|nr:VUT family protein [Erysipelotrichales bacterium]
MNDKKNKTFLLKEWIIQEKEETEVLLRSIPATTVSLFVVSVICMNLLANKTLFQNYYIALDGGILISWLSYMCMDIITKYFGPKASNKIAVLASSINVLTCFIFYIASIIPSNANDYTALDEILGGTWFILLGSTIAFLISAVINNCLNWSIGKAISHKWNSKVTFAIQSYISTLFGQFIDNLIFSLIVFVGFAPIFWDGFHWTVLQCTTCALTGAFAELIMEIVFSPFGYKILMKWKEHEVGREYITYMNGGKQE